MKIPRYDPVAGAKRAIAHEGATSLTARIADAFRRAIRDGDLEPGSRLPSTRRLAQRLRVSRNTVLAAYDVLAVEGLVVARRGSGTRVANRAEVHMPDVATTLDARRLLRAAHYPRQVVRLRDPDGNVLAMHR